MSWTQHRAKAIAFCDAFPDNMVKNSTYDVLFGEDDQQFLRADTHRPGA